MREPGDSARSTSVAGGAPESADQLDGEPVKQHKCRRNLDGRDEDDDEDQGDDSDARIDDEESAHHACYGSAGADGGYGAAEVQQRLQRACGHSASEVKKEKARGAERVFQVRAEDPEEPHVADDVHPAGVEEHVADQSGEADVVGYQRVIGLKAGRGTFSQETEEVQHDKRDNHDGRRRAAQECA